MELISSIGEFGLIERLGKLLPKVSPDVLVGIGDDVAVIRRALGEPLLLATCDSQVEGVHFRRDWTTPYQLGRKTAAVNISDIAAMGGRPLHFLISLAVPPDTDAEFLDSLYAGFAEEAVKWGADVIGGNISRSESLQIHVTLLGEVHPGHLLTRCGAKPGDRIYVTGTPGMSRAGLELLKNPQLRVDDKTRETCLAAHLTPTPRIREAIAIAESGLATAMIDVSDGLAGDLKHLCDSSGVGAEIWQERIPVAPEVEAVANAAGADPLEWVIGGGEDYELLITSRSDSVHELLQKTSPPTGTETASIGCIRSLESGRHLRSEDGAFKDLALRGWDHFT